jgi:myo-inositol 2-dehydrogenase/D-chiro-inositol 1-dehydrogenase
MEKVKIGIVGLGRLGMHHAQNLQYKVRNAELTAACSLVPEELEAARKRLGVQETYTDYAVMLENKALDAVFIASSTSEHAGHIAAAMKAGFHVFSEKPIALETAECLRVQKVVETHRQQVFMLGFQRRFDPSYTYAKEKIEANAIGTPFLVRSQTSDLDKYAEFQVAFTQTSGGIFLDANVHDIDLARWYLKSELESVYAIGGCYEHKAFEQYQDADNTTALCRFKNGTMATISASRTAMHGHHTTTEILGTKGILRIGYTPAINRVEILDHYGVRQECVDDFYTRFETAFLLEAEEFINCIVEGRKPEITAEDGTRATEAAIALTRSYKENTLIRL